MLFQVATSLPVTLALIHVVGVRTNQIILIGQDTKAVHHQPALDQWLIIPMEVRNQLKLSVPLFMREILISKHCDKYVNDSGVNPFNASVCLFYCISSTGI